MKFRVSFFFISFLLAAVSAAVAQTASSSVPAGAQVPRLIKFTGVAKDESGKPLTGVVPITFALYREQQGDTPLWVETQDVEIDLDGRYTTLLGSNTVNGVPSALFNSAEVHWIGTQVSGQPEEPRVALLSVPYALKAADAETLGGLPASAFMRSTPGNAPASAGSQAKSTQNSLPDAVAAAAVAGSGTKNFVPLWTAASTLGNSVIFQTGGHVGVGTESPGAAVDSASTAIALRGTSSGSKGTGVVGVATSTTGTVTGVSGSTNSTTNLAAGVSGFEGAKTGQVFGVTGSTDSTTQGAAGVNGFAAGGTGIVFGVVGGTNSTSNGTSGVNGFASATSGVTTGVSGTTNSPSAGSNGVFGQATATTGVTFGVQGTSSSSSGVGVQGSSPNTALSGINQTCGSSGCTIHAGTAGTFVTATGGTLLLGLSGSSLNSVTEVFSVDSAGNVFVKGKLTKGSGSFKIDDPLDPANKYLSHSFVESPDMMNIYNGNVTTDRHGLATIILPKYFEALNRDFRYQLTVVGQFAQAIVKQEVKDNRFTIKTSRPLVKVSWQVTGIRHDAYADAHRILVEEDKPLGEQGYYLHPELFGAPESRSIGAAQSPVAPSQAIVPEARR